MSGLKVTGITGRADSFRFAYRAPKWPPWEGDYCVNTVRMDTGEVAVLSTTPRNWAGPEAIAIKVGPDDAEFVAMQLFADHVAAQHGDFT